MSKLDRDTLEMVLSTLQQYGERKLTPEFLIALDEKDQFPADVLADLYDPEQLGLHLLFFPEEHGGLGGGAYDIYRVSETLAGMDLGIATGVLATFLGTDPIVVGATPEQKAHWLRRIAEERLLVAYGATEPQAGSDLATLKTAATPVVEDGKTVGYRLTGRKQWISNGGVAGLYTILANAPGGPSWFIVEKGADGFTYGKQENKHGIRASNTAPLFLEDVYVTADRLVGGVEGKGLAQAQAVFGYTRLMVAAFGLGGGWAALKRAIAYSEERVQGGSLLADKQGFTHKLLIPNVVRLEAARAYIEWVAERLDAGEPDLATEGAIAKFLATESGNKAAEDAIQAHGGNGYVKEYMVEKIKRDVRITLIYEGTSEILEWTIARDRWQHHLKTRGAYYKDWAARLNAQAQKSPDCGLATAALAMQALTVVLERARIDRLTRHQHVLFRLGELITLAETAAIFSERVAKEPSTASPVKASAHKALARLHARDAALRVVTDGARWLMGAGQTDPQLLTSLAQDAVLRAQAGLIDDMTEVAHAIRTNHAVAERVAA
ncbi:MAG: acyl-CoA dehydrogenase family protein [Deltaproteobacteria bacterium]|nr:acyl-CoA dehydrogenase family protein [Deltaproteobacteria bacterium]